MRHTLLRSLPLEEHVVSHRIWWGNFKSIVTMVLVYSLFPLSTFFTCSDYVLWYLPFLSVITIWMVDNNNSFVLCCDNKTRRRYSTKEPTRTQRHPLENNSTLSTRWRSIESSVKCEEEMSLDAGCLIHQQKSESTVLRDGERDNCIKEKEPPKCATPPIDIIYAHGTCCCDQQLIHRLNKSFRTFEKLSMTD